MKTGQFVAAVAAVAAALAAAAGQVTLLSLDVPGQQATLLVRRSPDLGMRLVESESSLCARQRPGSPLHSVAVPASFCPLALASGPWVESGRVLVRLPYWAPLHRDPA